MWTDLNDVDTSPEALTKLQVDLCKSWDDPWELLECRVRAAKTIAVLQNQKSEAIRERGIAHDSWTIDLIRWVDARKNYVALLQEAADEIEAYINVEYGTPTHPALQRRYERDMDIVYRLRAAAGWSKEKRAAALDDLAKQDGELL